MAQAKFILDYHRKKGDGDDIYKILRDKLCFRQLSDVPEEGDDDLPDGERIIFTQDNSGFRHEDGDSAKPQYKMFSWESWRNILGGTDCIKIHTVLNKDATLRVDYIRRRCWIRTYGDRCGWITNSGDAEKNEYETIYIVDDL